MEKEVEIAEAKAKFQEAIEKWIDYAQKTFGVDRQDAFELMKIINIEFLVPKAEEALEQITHKESPRVKFSSDDFLEFLIQRTNIAKQFDQLNYDLSLLIIQESIDILIEILEALITFHQTIRKNRRI